MTLDAAALEHLAALEDIRQLKYRYLRCVDLKLWDEIAEVFTADATADYGTHVTRRPLSLRGRDEIVGYLRKSLGPDITTLHRCGQPEIKIETTKATGTWAFEDTVIAMAHRVLIKGAAFYEDEYERGADGQWRICHIGYRRIYETMQSLDDTPSLRFLDTMWDAPADSVPRAAGRTATAEEAAPQPASTAG
ncbi:MAG TPA: nuclear transport factor 2 family protein [Streptosporangiaceae bacterium]